MKAGHSRNADLAKIHIAKKDLDLDRDTYEQLLFSIARVRSASDLDGHGRRRVLEYFKSVGWKPRRVPQARRSGASAVRSGAATAQQLSLIRHLWKCLGDAQVVRSGSEAALRAWLLGQTKQMNGHGGGYSAPEFLPDQVAARVIEMLKKWAHRCNVDWRHPDGRP